MILVFIVETECLLWLNAGRQENINTRCMQDGLKEKEQGMGSAKWALGIREPKTGRRKLVFTALSLCFLCSYSRDVI